MSANRVIDYPGLKEILEGERRIVYLCGAGASMSLGNHKLNWENWLLAGKGYLPEDVREVFAKKAESKSSHEMIEAASMLLGSLKANGYYDDFMGSTIGKQFPSNTELARAFCNIFRANDLVATTNYDLLIETAVHTEGISYADPEYIWKMIRGESDNKVLHLHGMYDRLHGVDNIIADAGQYGDIIRDEGVQFIQRLIGTHPLILIGCGATVEDPNLAGFMAFLTEKLKIHDIPYCYVMKEGDDVPELPENAIPVYYGTEYADLSAFMAEMTNIRLRSRIKGNRALVSINPYSELPAAASAFGRMHFSSRFHDFIGRDEELAALNGLLELDGHFKWWCVSGDGGIGKSRLVLEWLRRLPTSWAGFFINKDEAAASAYVLFTNTVFVVDYVLGAEKKCAGIIEALSGIAGSTGYQVRIVFIERKQKEADAQDFWLRRILEYLPPAVRLEFEAAQYREDFHEIEPLSEAHEREYVLRYLLEYLPLLAGTDYIDGCRQNMEVTAGKIHESYRMHLGQEFYRPLFLSIYIEVWLSREGRLSIRNSTELLREYLTKEQKRWRVLTGDDDIALSYLRVLAVASAVGRFNMTDVNGSNYIQEDCDKLAAFLERQRRIPGTENLYRELFVMRDEAVDTDGKSVFQRIMQSPLFADCGGGGTNDREVDGCTAAKSRAVKPEQGEGIVNGREEDGCAAAEGRAAKLEQSERFAYASPYIKLDADPELMFYLLLDGADELDDAGKETLSRLEKKREEKYADMPDYAWVLEPMLPDLIREYLVLYAVSEQDAARFTRLARSNSVLEFSMFLVRAAEDWPESELFRKMIITPPGEVFNFFEYYAGILQCVRVLDDFRPVERQLINQEYTTIYYLKYEMEIWRRIAVVLTDRGDIERLCDSSERFFEYAGAAADHPLMGEFLTDVITAYGVGIHNTGRLEKYCRFVECCYRLSKQFTEYQDLSAELIRSYGRLLHLRRYHGRTEGAGEDWGHIKEYSLMAEYGGGDDIPAVIAKAAQEYLHVLADQEDLVRMNSLVEDLDQIYDKFRTFETAEITAIACANVQGVSERKHRIAPKVIFERLKYLLADYPQSQKIRLSYIRCAEMAMHSEGERDIPKKVLAQAKEWEKMYVDELEFKEAYFGMLLTHFFYVRGRDMRNEQRRTLKEMKEVADRADYSGYFEENEMKATLRYLEML